MPGPLVASDLGVSVARVESEACGWAVRWPHNLRYEVIWRDIRALAIQTWVWLKITQEGQTAGFGPCFHLGFHFGIPFFLSPSHMSSERTDQFPSRGVWEDAVGWKKGPAASP